MKTDAIRTRRFTAIILGYPFALMAIATLVNLGLTGIRPLAVGLPTTPVLAALILSALLLLANHTWLMTSTELARLRYGMQATPEEWAESGRTPGDIAPEGHAELQRRQNAHRNATENSVIFAVLAGAMVLSSPAPLAAQIWMIGFAIGRLGHSYGFLSGQAGLRGGFMSVSLTALYGMAGYLLLALVF